MKEIKFTQKQLKLMVDNGIAWDISGFKSRLDLPEQFQTVGCSEGKNGLNGLLLRGNFSGNLYAVVSNSNSNVEMWR